MTAATHATFGGVVAAERIKLMSTRSPWWCAALAVAGVIGLVALFVLTAPADAEVGSIGVNNPFLQFALVLTLVMATVSVTSEYRFGTIRTTFQAVPTRATDLLAKAAVVAVAGGVVGLAAGFGGWATVWVLQAGEGVSLSTPDEWRAVAGAGLVFAAGAVLALAVGVLIRQTAGAVSLLLVWTLLLENLVALIPEVGEKIQGWMPFVNAGNVLSAVDGGGLPLSPWGSMAYLAAIALGMLVVATVVAQRRDA